MENRVAYKKDNTAFEVSDLCFAYGEKAILKKVNFQIPKGKIVTLMGPNGCGKSTLFQLMTKNLVPSLGTIHLNGQNIAKMNLKEFATQAAIVHQYNTAPSDLSVEQLVSYGRTPYHRFGVQDKESDEKYINRALKITGLDNLRNRSVAQLSGGQKQRVWIAMALAQGTDILLLDEPTTYLDVRYQIQLLQLIQALNRHFGTTIVMVLHDINQAIAYSDEIIALSPRGELVAQGAPERIMTSENLKKMYHIDLETAEISGKHFVLTI